MKATVTTALLFDFNGVLVDDEPIHFQAFRRVLGSIGHALHPYAYRRYLGLDDRGTLAAFLHDQGADAGPADMDALVEQKQATYVDLMRGPPRLFPGARDLVLGLRSNQTPLAVVSGARRTEIESVLCAAHLDGCFSTVVAAEDVDRCKPDPQGYRLGFERLRRLFPDIDRGVAIEDAPAGVAAARQAGLRCIGITTTCSPAELEGADRVIHSLKEIDLRQLTEGP
jgi:beta-phosphoglucomutase